MNMYTNICGILNGRIYAVKKLSRMRVQSALSMHKNNQRICEKFVETLILGEQETKRGSLEMGKSFWKISANYVYVYIDLS